MLETDMTIRDGPVGPSTSGHQADDHEGHNRWNVICATSPPQNCTLLINKDIKINRRVCVVSASSMTSYAAPTGGVP